jgi:hypothetical protein
MKSSNHPDRQDDKASESLSASGLDADSLDGSGFTDEMHDGEAEADDHSGTRTTPSGDGGPGSR